MSGKVIRVALAGNPNAGKTTIFNHLTGARQYVANYPGATVEKKSGRRQHGPHSLEIVDLPGTYSLTAYSPEELVARDYCIDESPDAIVDVVDASNLERNLYLAVQFMELGAPLVIALNMIDLAKSHGIEIDQPQLSKLLGVTIIPTVGTRGTGIDQLIDAVINEAEQQALARPARIDYGRDIEQELSRIQPLVSHLPNRSAPDAGPRGPGGPSTQGTPAASADTAADPSAEPGAASSGDQVVAAAGGMLLRNLPPRWLAVKLLEGDEVVLESVRSQLGADFAQLQQLLEQARGRLESLFSQGIETAMADRRYGFISGACHEAVRTTAAARYNISDRADSIILHRIVGLVIFAAMMFGVFNLVFAVGDPLMTLLEQGKGFAAETVAGLWPDGSDSPLKGLLVDGIIEGVGSVLIFLPNIALLFLALAFLEDSGYLARAAFLMDRIMHHMGLHGKSFIPMLMGFGCSVPGILATRTLDTRRDRLITMFVLPLVSCNARLPIYLIILPAFFPGWMKAPLLWMLYMIGIGLAIVMAKLLRGTVFRGEAVPFVIELPPYRMPTLRSVLMHTWERSSGYIKRAGTVILLITIVMWAASSYPKLPEDQAATADDAAAIKHSAVGRTAAAIEPVMRPMGFDWRITTGIIPALLAKEMFVVQMGFVHNLEVDPDSEDDDEGRVALQQQLANNYTPLIGLCVMLFCLISTPCIGTLAATWRESGKLRWALLQMLVLTFLAYSITTAVYQIGSMLGLGVNSAG